MLSGTGTAFTVRRDGTILECGDAGPNLRRSRRSNSHGLNVPVAARQSLALKCACGSGCWVLGAGCDTRFWVLGSGFHEALASVAAPFALLASVFQVLSCRPLVLP